MRKAWFLAAATAASLAVAGLPQAHAASPKPGTPAYIERDVANIQAAYGRGVTQPQTPGYLPAITSDAVNLELAQLEAQAGRPDHPSATLGALIPEGVGDPSRNGWADHRGRQVPVSFAAADGALLQGTLFAPLPH